MEIYNIEGSEPLLGDWAIPVHFLPPVTFYVIQVGTKEVGVSIFKWGITDDWKERLKLHRTKYENVITRILISVGQTNARRIEDNVKAMLGRRRIILSIKSHPHGLESFKVNSNEGVAILHGIRLHVETRFHDICRYSWMDGKVHYDRDDLDSKKNKLLEVEQEKNRHAIAMEQEKTRNELAILRQARDNLLLQIEHNA